MKVAKDYQTISTSVISEIKDNFHDLLTEGGMRRTNTVRETVLARFQPIFSTEHLTKITTEEFHSFLLFENNQHWTGLTRQSPRLTKSRKNLSKALLILADDSRPVGERLEDATQLVDGMGKGIATAVLLIMFPEKYGVWNGTSEAALIELGVWPDFPRGTSFGARYECINEILRSLSQALQMDLWTVDWLMWRIVRSAGGDDVGVELRAAEGGAEAQAEELQTFGLERHLHEFMRDNWHKLELGKEWVLYGEPGDDSPGYEYPTSIGRIDLLAKHRKRPQWLVIELKRSQGDDQTVGQVLRYMGWVRQNLADPKDSVEGLIVAKEGSEKIQYALESVSSVSFKLYSVEFRLHD